MCILTVPPSSKSVVSCHRCITLFSILSKSSLSSCSVTWFSAESGYLYEIWSIVDDISKTPCIIDFLICSLFNTVIWLLSFFWIGCRFSNAWSLAIPSSFLCAAASGRLSTNWKVDLSLLCFWEATFATDWLLYSFDFSFCVNISQTFLIGFCIML